MPNSKIALAQLVEHGPFKPVVAGSSPACGKELVVSFKPLFLLLYSRMSYLWIAIAVLLIVLFTVKLKETFDNMSDEPKQCNDSCPVHGSIFDPPYPHAFHYTNLDSNRKKVYECSKCRCRTTKPDNYTVNLDL